MSTLERLTERLTRSVARRTSRRSMLGKVGMILMGGSALPLLPIARGSAATQEIGPEPEKKGYPGVLPQSSLGPAEDGDQASCDYWRHCNLGGTLCACCGGSSNACPPGSVMSPLGWVGTCLNPKDGKSYVISYNDCCGQPECSRCACGAASTNRKNRPPVRPQSSDNVLWCLGIEEVTYTCSAALVLGVALDNG